MQERQSDEIFGIMVEGLIAEMGQEDTQPAFRNSGK